MVLTAAQSQFAAKWIRVLLGPECDSAAVPQDLLALVFRELSRKEETECSIRDQWGNWEWPYSKAAHDGTLYVPRADIAVLNWGENCSVARRQSLWPDNRPFTICLTHDVDFISRRSTSMRFVAEMVRRTQRVQSAKSKMLTSLLPRYLGKWALGPCLRFGRKDEYHRFDKCMEMEDRFGFKSTFFFFAEHLPLPHIFDCGYSHSDNVQFFSRRVTVSEMMREMLQRGWDVGLHGSYLSAKDLPALAEEKRQVEESSGVAVQSVRHHYLSYDTGVTPLLHEQAGFRADSTQGFNRNIGFRAGTSFPYYCWDHAGQRSTGVLEIPLHVMDGPLLGVQGLECDDGTAITYLRMVMDRVAEVGGCLVLNWHPSWLCLEPYLNSYEWILREAHERNAWGCSVKSLLSWAALQLEV